jgi:hypothetical protein
MWHAYLTLVPLPVQQPATTALSTTSVAALSYVARGAELGARVAQLVIIQRRSWAFVTGDSAGRNITHHITVRHGSGELTLATLRLPGCMTL